MKNLLIILALITAALTSCSNKDNSALTRYKPQSKEFKQTLAAEMAEHPDTFEYTFAGYEIEGNKEFLNIDVSRDDFKTTLAVAVNKWGKIAGIKRTKGVGYHGAQLEGLKLALVNDTEFEYLELKKIAD